MKSEYVFYFKNGHLRKFKANNKRGAVLRANDKQKEPTTIKNANYICKVDFNDEEIVIELLKDFESKHKSDLIEHAMVILPSGEVYTCSGNENGVMVDEIFKDKLEGSYVTHNHPLSESEYTFSSNDMELFVNMKLKKLRGIDEKYTYEFSTNAFEIDEMPPDWDEETIYHHCNMIRLAKEYGIGYKRWENE